MKITIIYNHISTKIKSHASKKRIHVRTYEMIISKTVNYSFYVRYCIAAKQNYVSTYIHAHDEIHAFLYIYTPIQWLLHLHIRILGQKTRFTPIQFILFPPCFKSDLHKCAEINSVNRKYVNNPPFSFKIPLQMMIPIA